MYNKIHNGKCVEIQGLECWIPPLGMGTHCDTAEIKPVDIIKRSNIKSEQYWEPQSLPGDFEEQVDIENDFKQRDPSYYDAELSAIREREWRRRLYGVWVYINGTPVYLTGLNYYYLNYWMLDIGLPDYREIDVEYYYFWQYCVEDPDCFGMIEVRKRRDGKSFRAGCMLEECISRTKNALGGIQSKEEISAGELFDKAIVPQFQTLPSFFRPIWDTSSGSTPRGSLRFHRPSKKGKSASKNLTGEELKSVIDYRNSKAKAYDGSKTKRLVLDESGKVEVDVITRHLIVKHCCVDQKGKIIGKMLVTSTCEMIGIEFRFDVLWKWSDQSKREDNGKTKSGLYSFFMTASRSGDYDKYGVPDEARTLKRILDDRLALQNEPDDYIDAVRKEPLTIVEAFKVASSDCVYNFIKLSDRESELGWLSNSNLTTTGDFDWQDGIKYSKVIWVASKKGRWQVSHLLGEGESNKVVKRGRTYYPDNAINFCAGSDPFDINKTKDKRGGSRGTVYVKWKFSIHNQSNPCNNNLIVRYANRPQLSDDYYDDVIKTIWYYGAEMLAERNKYGLIKYMVNEGVGGFLIWLNGETDYGLYASYESNQELTRVTKDFINKRVHDVPFPELIKQWIKFDPSDTTKSDEAMAAGYALMADVHHVVKQNTAAPREVTEYFRMHKAV